MRGKKGDVHRYRRACDRSLLSSGRRILSRCFGRIGLPFVLARREPAICRDTQRTCQTALPHSTCGLVSSELSQAPPDQRVPAPSTTSEYSLLSSERVVVSDSCSGASGTKDILRWHIGSYVYSGHVSVVVGASFQVEVASYGAVLPDPSVKLAGCEYISSQRQVFENAGKMDESCATVNL